MVSKARVGVGAAVALLAACGGARSVAVPEPAPPVRAVDAPLSASLRARVDLALGIAPPGTAPAPPAAVTACWSWSKTGPSRPCTHGQAAELATLRERQLRDLRPAKGAAPRTVAELPLGRGRRMLLVAWRARLGRLCLLTADTPSGGGSTAFGPCEAAAMHDAGLPQTQRDRCDALCLDSRGSSTGGRPLSFSLAGLVAPGATSLRVTLAGGAVRLYPLRGPLLHGSGRRVFMTDLGVRDWRKLELLRGDTVLATRAMSTAAARAEDCRSRFGDAGPAAAACLRAATGGPFPP